MGAGGALPTPYTTQAQAKGANRRKWLRILHVLAQLPCKTGSGIYYCNVIERLEAYGHAQAALYASQDGVELEALRREVQYPVQFKCAALPFPIAGMSDVMPYENTVYGEMDDEMLRCWFYAFREALLRARAEFKPDVVVLHHLWMLTSLAAELFDTEVTVGICHNTDLRQAKQNPALLEKYVRSIHKLDAVFALSDAQRGAIAAQFYVPKERIVTLGGGYNEKLFYPAARKSVRREVRLIYAAKIDASKGIYELVEAFRLLHRAKPNTYLSIYGAPSAENAARLRAATEGQAGITVHGAVPQAELAQLLREADIFVLPSYYEGIALSAVESLASGLRAVTTEIEPLMALLGGEVNRSGVIEYVRGPRVVDTDKPVPEDLPAFVERLAAALQVQVECVERGDAFPPPVVEKLAQLSWHGVIAKLHGALVELCAGRWRL